MWAISVTLFGYFVGSKVPGIQKYVDPILVGIVLVTLVPTIYHALKDPKIRAKLFRRSKKS